MMPARRDGACCACGARILAGVEIEWNPGIGPRCVECVRGRVFPPVANTREQSCRTCGGMVAPGDGWLTWRDDYDSSSGQFLNRVWFVAHRGHFRKK